jgi:membrane fusion protein (multidrug efflux system)
MKVRTSRGLALLCAAAVSAGCGADTEAPAPPSSPVLMTSVVPRDVVEQIEASGELLAKNRAEIAAQVAGQITEIVVEEGDAVEADAVVIEIDPERRNLDVANARAGAAEAEVAVTEKRRELERSKTLHGRQVASQQQLEQRQTELAMARSRLLAAQAQLGGAERALRDASVTAPFAGMIARRSVSRGEYVQPGQPLFELVSLDPIEVEFHVTERDSSRVRVGLPVDLRVAPYPDETFRATVTIVSPTIDTRTRTLRAKALLANPDRRLRPGLFARIDLGVDRRTNVPMVPEEAILQRADGAVVFRVLRGDRVERRVIELGVIRDGWIEVRSGLAAGDVVVQRGHADLIDGSVVAARNSDGTPVVSSAPADEPESAHP